MGHCHPRVVEALHNQAGKLNTHTRYLSETVIGYAEKLAGLMQGEFQVCLFVNSGTEANELAMRIARTVSGHNGAIVMEASYHGNSTLMNETSTLAFPVASERAPHIAAVVPPNTYRGPYRAGEHDRLGARYADLVDAAIDELQAREVAAPGLPEQWRGLWTFVSAERVLGSARSHGAWASLERRRRGSE